MKRFTLIALCAAAAAAGIDAGAVLKVPSRNHTAPAKRTHAELKALLRAASENPLCVRPPKKFISTKKSKMITVR